MGKSEKSDIYSLHLSDIQNHLSQQFNKWNVCVLVMTAIWLLKLELIICTFELVKYNFWWLIFNMYLQLK